jgi:hypothetical protein
MLAGELEALYGRLPFKNMNGKSYFVQVRLILHMYDTKALEHRVKGVRLSLSCNFGWCSHRIERAVLWTKWIWV